MTPLDPQHWGVYESYPAHSYSVLYNNHIDYKVLYNGQPTLRIDPHTAADTNGAREAGSLSFSIHSGQHIVFSCWMKVQTGPGTTWFAQHGCGARIGVDFYSDHYLTGISWAGPYVYPWQSWTDQAVADNWVCDANGGVWQQRTIDFIMPSLVHDDYRDPNGTLGLMAAPYAIIPWMQASPCDINDKTQSAVWFGDPQLRITS